MPAAAAILAILVGLIVVPLFSTLVGAFVGFIVGGFFPETFGMMLDVLGLEKAAPWQFGAMCGFVGGFFRSSSSK